MNRSNCANIHLIIVSYIFSFRKIEYSLLRGCVKLNGKVVTKKSIEVKTNFVLQVLRIECYLNERLIL